MQEMNTADQLLRKWEKQIGKIIGLRNEVNGMIEKCNNKYHRDLTQENAVWDKF